MPDPATPERDEITVDGTKYRFVEDPKGGFSIDRYDEPWLSAEEVRRLPGIKAFIALFYRAVALERGNAKIAERQNKEHIALLATYRRLRFSFIVSVCATVVLLALLIVSVMAR